MVLAGGASKEVAIKRAEGIIDNLFASLCRSKFNSFFFFFLR